MRNNFSDFLFAAMPDKPLSKRGLLLKEETHSFIEDLNPYEKGGKTVGEFLL